MNGAIVPFAVASYLLGAFPTAIVAGKALRGIDVRNYGSHNAGATNVWRVLGARPAIAVLLIDALKGALAVIIGWYYFGSQSYAIVCGLMAIVGHIWTVFAGFRGGKGVGTAAGVFAALAPWVVLVAVITFVAVVYVTRYISAGSIAAAAVLGIGLIVERVFYPERVDFVVVIVGAAVAVLVIVKHHSNIKRLLSGAENKFGRAGTISTDVVDASKGVGSP